MGLIKIEDFEQNIFDNKWKYGIDESGRIGMIKMKVCYVEVCTVIQFKLVFSLAIR